MRRARRSFARSMRRAYAVPALIFVVASTYVLSTELLTGSALLHWKTGRERPAVEQASNTPAWRSDYDQRFQGCVPAERWPRDRMPGSLVVVRRSSVVERMRFDEAFDRSRNRNRADDVWVVGGCR